MTIELYFQSLHLNETSVQLTKQPINTLFINRNLVFTKLLEHTICKHILSTSKKKNQNKEEKNCWRKEPWTLHLFLGELSQICPWWQWNLFSKESHTCSYSLTCELICSIPLRNQPDTSVSWSNQIWKCCILGPCKLYLKASFKFLIFKLTRTVCESLDSSSKTK